MSRRRPAPKRLRRRGRMLLVASALGLNAGCGGDKLVGTADGGLPANDGGATDAGLVFGVILHHDGG